MKCGSKHVVFSLNDLKIKYLGKKGLITELNSEIKNIPNEEKKDFGMQVNALRNVLLQVPV